MEDKIQKQIDNIRESIEWIRINKPDDFNKKFLLLSEKKCILRKIKNAYEENPAIAAFGESQKGKSYLMGNLLQNNGKPFMIKVNNGADEVDFVQNINPIGDKKEATGVVTRFKVFSEIDEKNKYNGNLPVIVKLLTPSRIATILCDTYHKDLQDYQIYEDQELKDFSKELFEKYKDAPDLGNQAFTEDDVLDIKYYLTNFVTETQSLRRSGYFENLALVIRKIPVKEWVSVFSILWHRNEVLSSMFSRMINALQKLGFAEEVYVDIETVRHHGNNINTIMSVDCLNGLDDSTWDKATTVYLKNAQNEYTAIPNMSKCELAAVCAETVFKIEKEYALDEMKYGIVDNPDTDNGDMPEESINELKHRSINKSLLNDSDLLDFPGARNRLHVKEVNVSKKDDKGVSNSVQMFLRGKVAHLFNSYSDSRMVNILLFCHDAEAIVVNAMYIMVEEWVNRYVGKTAEERGRTIARYGQMSPLFNICTKFNIDMIEDEHVEKNNEAALNQRWYGRLIKVLYTQAFKANDVDWFKNWDKPNSPFKNSYLLRDYKYSGCTGSGSHLYAGYKDTDQNPSEKSLELSSSFYDLMRKTFIQSKDVEVFFENPRLAWDVAASRNNDGSLYIIERLCKVAKNAANARTEQFNDELEKIAQSVTKVMSEYYVSSNIDELLEKNISKARAIFREMDFTCNSDNYYFGHLIQALQISEPESYKVVHKVMQSSEINAKVNDFKDYEIIRSSCENSGYSIDDVKDDAGKWQCLMNTYGFSSQKEAEDYLVHRQIDVQKLFNGTYKRKLNSCIIADSVYNYWCEKIKSVDFLNQFAGDGDFDTAIMTSLLEQLISTASNMNIADRMASLIADYVNVIDIHVVNESLIADMLTDVIQDFVLDFGFEYLSDEDKAKAKKVCQSRNIPAFNFIEKEMPGVIDEAILTALFNEMSTSPKALLPSFEDNYHKWIEYMFISFVANLEIPDYDHEANAALENILECIKKG